MLHCVWCVLCCVCCAVCVVCSMRCVLCAVRCVLCAVRCVCAVCGVCCVLCGAVCAMCCAVCAENAVCAVCCMLCGVCCVLCGVCCAVRVRCGAGYCSPTPLSSLLWPPMCAPTLTKRYTVVRCGDASCDGLPCGPISHVHLFVRLLWRLPCEPRCPRWPPPMFSPM